MDKRTTFIGHRYLWGSDKDIRNRLSEEVKKQIEQGCKFFTVGVHGEFDKLSLSVCRELRKTYKDIEIEVVITSFNQVNPIINYDPIFGTDKYYLYNDVKTIMYDIEEEHYKRKITVSNRQMIDTCDTLICYVDTTRTYGGAILAYKYAKKKGLQIVNLYQEKI